MSTQDYRSILDAGHLEFDFVRAAKVNRAAVERLWSLPTRPMPAHRGAASLVCVGIGDAVGRPAEGQNPPTTLARYRRWAGWRRGPIGTITDDTQMTLWLARSILESDGFNGEDLVRRFTAERIRGIGRATREFMAHAKSGEPWYRTGVQSAGNGVAMRSAPVGIRYAHSFDDLVTVAGLQAMVTHNDPMAIASGIVVATAVALLGSAANGDAEALTVPEVAARFSRALGELIRGMEAGRDYRTRNTGLSDTTQRDTTQRDTLFNRLTDTVPRLLLSSADPRTADRELYSGAYVLESLPFALFCFLRRATEPIDAILDAVNNSRDSDTVGAICGGFAGALNGIAGIDPYWVEELEFAEELDRLGRALANAMSSSR